MLFPFFFFSMKLSTVAIPLTTYTFMFKKRCHVVKVVNFNGLYQGLYRLYFSKVMQFLSLRKVSEYGSMSAQAYLQLPLRQWGAGNVYLLVLSSWKVNIAEKPHCRNGVVDTFRPSSRAKIFKRILKLYNVLYFNLCILMCFRWWLYVPCYGLYHKYGPITKPTSFLIGQVFCYPWYKLHLCLVSIQQLLCLGNAMSGFVWCLRWGPFAFLLAFWRTSARQWKFCY